MNSAFESAFDAQTKIAATAKTTIMTELRMYLALQETLTPEVMPIKVAVLSELGVSAGRQAETSAATPIKVVVVVQHLVPAMAVQSALVVQTWEKAMLHKRAMRRRFLNINLNNYYFLYLN